MHVKPFIFKIAHAPANNGLSIMNGVENCVTLVRKHLKNWGITLRTEGTMEELERRDMVDAVKVRIRDSRDGLLRDVRYILSCDIVLHFNPVKMPPKCLGLVWGHFKDTFQILF